MSLQHASTRTSNHYERPGEAETRLHGRRLIIARLGAVALTVLTVVVLLPLLPAFMSYLYTVCIDAACPVGQLTPSTVQALQTLGISVNTFVAYTVALTLLSLLMCWSVAAVIFLRKSDDWMALLVALMLVLMGTSYVTHLVLQYPSPWQVPALLLNMLAFGALFLVFSLFPSGQFVPSRMGLLPVSWMVWGLVITCFLHDHARFYQLYLLVCLGELIGIVGAQIYRYLRLSGPVQRQQTKWVVWGTSAAIVGVVVVSLPEAFLPSLVQPSWLYRLLDAPTLTLALFLGSLSIGIAILRYRLYEIDVLINRTLVYGTLTVTLALVYIGLVFGLQYALRSIVSQDNAIAVVISTLAIAALFRPLRMRFQAIIDRRFYRRKYDASRILQEFYTAMRNEVDLEQLSERLVAAVDETMQPAHISLWIRPPGKKDAGAFTW